MLKTWLKFFRIVNLPTVPGDVFVGAAAVHVFASVSKRALFAVDPWSVLTAAFVGCCLYLFGLADNDIVGAGKDGSERPIPAGALSLRAACVARALCLACALAVATVALKLHVLSPLWFGASAFLVLAAVLYNRTKWCLAIGLCRGLNVACGGLALVPSGFRSVPASAFFALLVVAGVWTVYIAAVTRYSVGEAENPAKRRRVGWLIGALVYLQLVALFVSFWRFPTCVTRGLLLAGAAMLIVLRVLKRSLPEVSAS